MAFVLRLDYGKNDSCYFPKWQHACIRSVRCDVLSERETNARIVAAAFTFVAASLIVLALVLRQVEIEKSITFYGYAGFHPLRHIIKDI